MANRLLPIIVLLGGSALLVAGVVALGRIGKARLHQEQHYVTDLSSIECTPPLGKDRSTFLSEVQYLSHLPTRLNLLDEDLPSRLYDAFGRHPLVEGVDDVQVILPDRVKVRLRPRVPVLAVNTPGGRRNVDAHGVLMPSTPAEEKLPVLTGKLTMPPVGVGTRWDDTQVQAAAATAALLAPHREEFRLTQIEVTPSGLVLAGPNRQVMWGAPPGQETADEIPGPRKIEALQAYVRTHGGLDRPGPSRLDVRSRTGIVQTPLSGS